MKRCPRCDSTKAVSEFGKHSGRPDGLSAYCVSCTGEYNRSLYETLRRQVVSHLGGICKSCGYNNPLALHIDHVQGGGTSLRKTGERGPKFFKLVLADTEGRYQILCANCNCIKLHESGERTRKQ